MKTKLATILAGAVALGAFATTGVWTVGRRSVEAVPSPTVAKVPARYHCPMHPGYVSARPGDCPICGMKLVATEAHAPRANILADRTAISLSPERRRVLGLRSEPVRKASLSRSIRTVGLVVPDERRLHHVHTKFEAWIEHLYVDYTGQFVRKGEALASLFSPELVASQQEYLLASRARRQLAASALPSVAQGGVDLLEAARQRLLLWDIRPEDVARLEQSGAARRTLDLHSPVSGYVTQKFALHGMRVTPAETLFDIADLSRLWVLADVYESDLPAIALGMPAELTLAYLPGKAWRGTVTHVAPSVDAKTRTIKVRVEVGNAAGELKPEMFADVVLSARMGEGLVVPESALLRTGERVLAFVDRDDGLLEPRELKVGAKLGEGVHVLAGLGEGERVVTAANFLLDSESSLKAALAAFSPAPPPAGGHAH